MGYLSNIIGGRYSKRVERSGSTKTSGYTLTEFDSAEFIEIGSGGSITVTNGVFSSGDIVTIINSHTSTRTIMLSISYSYIAGDTANKSSVTIAAKGLASILFLSSTSCIITGNIY